MPGKQAKILSSTDVNDLLIFATCTRHSVRNRLIVLLAAKAGLRAGEIAKLTWEMVLDPTGNIGGVIELRDAAAKNGRGRLIPMHPDLRRALAAYRGLSNGLGPLIRSERSGAMTSLSIVVWFYRAFRNVGLNGCSSHSGPEGNEPSEPFASPSRFVACERSPKCIVIHSIKTVCIIRNRYGKLSRCCSNRDGNYQLSLGCNVRTTELI